MSCINTQHMLDYKWKIICFHFSSRFSSGTAEGEKSGAVTVVINFREGKRDPSAPCSFRFRK